MTTVYQSGTLTPLLTLIYLSQFNLLLLRSSLNAGNLQLGVTLIPVEFTDTVQLPRKHQEAQLCFRIFTGHFIIPSSLLIPTLTLDHTNSRPLYYGLTAKTRSHLSSFKYSCVPIWNCLPSYCILAATPCTFKKAISTILL